MDKKNRVQIPEKYPTFFVSLSVNEAAEKIRSAVEEGSISGELLDDYTVPTENRTVRVLMFEKYFYRVENRLLLTVILDDAAGKTRVHSMAGGGGRNLLFKFDWFAGDDFAAVPQKALQEYIIDG